MSWLPRSAASKLDTRPANLLKAGLSRLPYRVEFDSTSLMPLGGPWTPAGPMCADLHRGADPCPTGLPLPNGPVFGALQIGLTALGV